ncbi:hypothetical protein TBLA_0J00970 [Henningerozyma blattae CBS 6284]|uniref:J domain-containing protein n=1 Tax=Henningerozyma blattae (strain ATCC 34711 / CBS 6284 / DSM 70876 / NBRC 10599 / NRRL Y-10934 / UCD 77-7) TaxID=1071380 RepID=I2H9P3_HENB6|nr:hypothetical protein TBLA_0J00970 [Tetrapisispora blattae CBS 6284]CCH63095.1 hypothetical protein TBLA_0J00970 [Tetrapisispora blattae CBS 6284]
MTVTDGVPNIDETTYYSVLGLTSKASVSEIRKSYMKLAKSLHPDKSKSNASEELFKIVSNAHSILIDPELKLDYDNTLLRTGLYTYKPSVSTQSSKPNNTSSNKTQNSSPYHTSNSPTKSHTKYSTNNQYFSSYNTKIHTEHYNKHNPHSYKKHTKPVDIPNYNSKRKAQPYEKQPYGFGTTSNIKPQSKTHDKPRPKAHDKPSQTNSYSTHSKPAFNLKSYETRNKTSIPTKKMEKESNNKNDILNVNGKKSTKDFLNETLNNSHSSQPNVTEPTNRTRPFLEEIEDEAITSMKFKNPKVTSTENKNNAVKLNLNGFSSQRSRHYARTKSDNYNYKNTRKSKSPTRIKSTEITGNWDNLKEILEKLNKETSSINKTDQNSHSELNFRSGLSDFQQIQNSLPSSDDQDKSFNMNEMFDLLVDELPGPKRQKIFSGLSNNEESDSEVLLSNPINRTLPHAYKPEFIPLEQYNIDLDLVDIPIPHPPTAFNLDTSSITNIENYKKQVIEFHETCNALKTEILKRQLLRINSEDFLLERLVRIENCENWISSQNYDLHLLAKLTEIQNVQNVVSIEFNNLMKNLSGLTN